MNSIHGGHWVRAFHPRMFGVIVYGTVERVYKGGNYYLVDFGPIHGGKFLVAQRDIVASSPAPFAS
jgi:hypothetical protein